MDALDDTVSQILSLSGNSEGLSQLSSILRNREEEFQKQPLAKLDSALNALEPATHSLGYLYLLESRQSLMSSLVSPDLSLSSISNFIEVCDVDQIRLAPQKYNSLTEKLRDLAITCKTYGQAILPLQIALQKIQPSPEHLTAQHGQLALVCLLAKVYGACSSYFLEDIFEVDPALTGVKARDFLLYCYYGGMICIGLRNFQRAHELLSHAVTAPARSLSAITVAAYKKYILVSLILEGSLPPLSKYTSSVVQRGIKSLCNDYLDFASAYETRISRHLRMALDSHKAVFQADSNFGLAKEALHSLTKRSIQRLTQTYITLSLLDIAELVSVDSPQEAEVCIRKMIAEGEIFATISQRDGMVHFLEDREQFSSKSMANKLHAMLNRGMKLGARISAVDKDVSCDKTYIAKVAMREKGTSSTKFPDPDDVEMAIQRSLDIM